MKKALRIVGYVVLGFVLLLGGVYLFFQTPIGKNWLGKKVSDYATDYLKTNVTAEINYRIPDWVVLENFLIEDQSRDTLLAGKSLRVDIDMWALLHSQAKINQIEVEGVRANVYRNQNDSFFNYEFLLDAFVTDTTISDTASNSFMLEVRNLSLKDIAASYRDDVVKNNARISLKSLETGFDKLDLENADYRVKDINIAGINAFVDFTALSDSATQIKEQQAGVVTESETTPLTLQLQDINLADARWDVRFIDLAIASKAIVDELGIEMEGLDINEQYAQIAAISLSAPKLTYDDLSAPVQPRGLDYGHIALSDFVIDAEDIFGSADSVVITLNNLAFKEKSGVNIQELSGNFQYSPTLFLADNFLFKTPNTKIGNKIELRHPDLLKIAESLEKATLDIAINDSFLGLSDVELLVPDLAADPYFQQVKRSNIYVDGRITGPVSNVNIPNLNIRGLNGSSLIANGRIRGLPNTEQLGFDLNITELSTTKPTLDVLLPDSIKQAYGLPQKVELAGTIEGSINDIVTAMTLQSDIGNGKINGKFQNFVAENATPKYDGSIELNNFDLQYLLKNDSLRTVSLDLDFEGAGIEPETMNASINGAITEAYFNGYAYNNIKLDAGITENKANFSVESNDRSLNGNLSGTADLSTEYPAIKASGDFQQLDFKALNLYAEPLALKGNLSVDMPSTNPSSPIGKITFREAAINQGRGFVNMGDIALEVDEKASQKVVNLTSDFAKLNLKGQFDYLTLADVLITEVSTYFEVPSVEYVPTTEPTNFQLTGSLSEHPLINSFVPELTDFNTITLKSTFDNTASESLTASISAPYVFYDSIAIRNANLNLNATAEVATYAATISSVEVSSFRLRKAALSGEIANDIMGFSFTVKDSLNREVHGLAGKITPEPSYYQIAMQSEGTRLYYRPWQANGSLDIYDDGIVAENIRFYYQGQELVLNSQRKVPNAPIDVTSRQLDLKQLSTAFLQDSTLVSGFFNADLIVKGLDGNPGFTGDFNVSELTVTEIPVGKLKANAANKGSEAISLDASLTGEGNSFRMFGDYNLTGKNPMDFTFNVNRLGAKTVQAFSFGEIERADGQMNGQLKVTGDPSDPIIRGELAFEKFDFVLKQLGAPYSLRNQSVAFNGQMVQMKNFTVKDSTGQELVVTGRVLFPDLPNYSYKLNVRANNFLAVNAKKFANDYFYGNASVDASMDIYGVNTNYTVNGDVKVVPGSNITVLIPDDEGTGNEMKELITFVDRSNPKPELNEDSVVTETETTASYLNASSEITLNVEVTDESELTVLVDETTGDYLRVRGNARLRTGFNASNELFLYGNYNITEGAYELSVSFAKRRFELLPDSYIRWTGDPLDGQVDIKATYVVETSLNGYFEDKESLPDAVFRALERPIDVVLLLYLENNLTTLNPSFGVGVREEDLNARGINNIDAIQSNGVTVIKENGAVEKGQLTRFVTENYINKQALWLLAAGRFKPGSNNVSSGGFNAEAVARKSVSRLLSDQLNQLASDAIKGVDLNVGVASEYATETGQRSTELNLGVSKTLLNDRLTLSVGRNFEFENAERQSSEIFDNILASYKLTEDGRYRLKAFRQNQYQTIQGFVVETGVSFVATMEYDKLREFFKRKEDDESKNLRNKKRKPEAKREEGEEEGTPPVLEEQQGTETQNGEGK